MRLALLAFLAAFATGGTALAGAIDTPETDYSRLQSLDRATISLPERDRGKAISDLYENLFRPRLGDSGLRLASSADLDRMLRFAHTVAFYSREPRHLADMQQVLSELESRGAASDGQRKLMYEALVGHRRFDEARLYRSRHPTLDVEPLPDLGRALPPSADEVLVYDPDPVEFRLSPRRLDIARGVRIVIVGHPACGFSRAAARFASTRPDVARSLHKHAVWITPVGMRLYFEEIQVWNRECPQFRTFITRHRDDWPMIAEWATPQFYLLRDGKVVDHLAGWPKDDSNQERLLRMLTAIDDQPSRDSAPIQ